MNMVQSVFTLCVGSVWLPAGSSWTNLLTPCRTMCLSSFVCLLQYPFSTPLKDSVHRPVRDDKIGEELELKPKTALFCRCHFYAALSGYPRVPLTSAVELASQTSAGASVCFSDTPPWWKSPHLCFGSVVWSRQPDRWWLRESHSGQRGLNYWGAWIFFIFFFIVVICDMSLTACRHSWPCFLPLLLRAESYPKETGVRDTGEAWDHHELM